MSENDTIHLGNFRILDVPGAVPALLMHPTEQEQKIDFLAQGTLVSHRSGPGLGQAYKINKKQFLKMGEALWGLGDTEFRKVFSSEKEQIFATHILLDCLHAQMTEVDRGAVLQLVKEKSGQSMPLPSKLLFDERKILSLLLALGLSQLEAEEALHRLLEVPGRAFTNSRDGSVYLQISQEELVQFCSQHLKDVACVDRQIELLHNNKLQAPSNKQLELILSKVRAPSLFTQCMSDIETVRQKIVSTKVYCTLPEIMASFKTIQGTLKKLEDYLSTAQKGALHEALQNLVLPVCLRSSLSEWPENLVRDFPFSQEERYVLAQEICKRESELANKVASNIKKLNLSPAQQLNIARMLIQQGKTISAYIGRFDIPNESDRMELAIQELRVTPAIDSISAHIKNYNIQGQNTLVAIAQVALNTGDGAAFFEHIQEYGIKNEETRFELCQQCLQKHGSQALSRWTDPTVLSVEHRIALLQQLDPHQLTTTLIERWSTFKLNAQTTKNLFFHFVEASPAVFYEAWEKVVPYLSRHDQTLLRARIPFFSLNESIKHANNEADQSPSRGLRELDSILQEIQDINRQKGVPVSLYQDVSLQEPKAKNLLSLVKTLAQKGTQEEILQLVASLQTHFFCGTNSLLYYVAQEAMKKVPGLSQYIRLPTDSLAGFSPLITAPMAQLVVTETLRKHKATQVFFPGVVYSKDLHNQLQRFYDSPNQKGVFLVNFSEKMKGHFSPLIVEKKEGVLHILSSDSVFKGYLPFSEEIVKAVKDLPFPKELYVVPQARQHDVFSCPVFSIVDLKEAIKQIGEKGESFFDYFKQHARLVQGCIQGVPIKQVVSLPVRMLRMTESMSQIREHAQTSPVFMSKGVPTTLTEYVTRDTFYQYDAKKNCYRAMNLAAARKQVGYIREGFEKCTRLAASMTPFLPPPPVPSQ